jgi:hypothetical protein
VSPALGPVLDALATLAVAGYAAAAALLAALGLHAFALAAVRLVRPPRPLPVVTPAGAWPAVVVQLPVYAEPAALVARALDAALALDYPGPVEVQLLDDSPAAAPGGGAANGALCAARHTPGRPVRHLVRAGRDGYKAGALAWGLAHTDAPFAAVFDVDFRPPPDALRRLVGPLLADPGLAFVQAVWEHPDDERTPLARAQAAVLDLHFAVEQAGRDRAGLPLVFNGSAGAWRVAAVRDAGGWQGDTLAEDYDLAVRAQAAGWRARLAEGVRVPADLPPTLGAWRRQQARWAKGLVEVGRKNAGVLWRSGLPLGARLAASAHAALGLSLPALLAVALLHPVVGAAQALGLGPGPGVFAALGAGYGALAGFAVAHVVAQRALHPRSWAARLAWLPLVLLAPLGLVVPAARAVAEAVRGRRTPFERTPKGGPPRSEGGLAEAALAAYSAAGAVALAALGAWGGLLFQAVLAAGFGASACAVRRPSGAAALPDAEVAPRAAA